MNSSEIYIVDTLKKLIIWIFKFPFVCEIFPYRIFHLDFSPLFGGVNLKDIRGVWKTVDYKIKSTVFGVLDPLTTELLVNQGRFFPPWLLVSSCVK